MIKRVATVFGSLLVFLSVLTGLYILVHLALPHDVADMMGVVLVVLGAIGAPALFAWLLYEVNR